MLLYGLYLSFMVMDGSVSSCTVLYDPECSCMVLCGPVCSCIVLFCPVRSGRVMYVLVSQVFGLVESFLVMYCLFALA